MKVKELIEELSKFNPDGVVSVTTIMPDGGSADSDCKVVDAEDSACALINPVIIARA